MKRIADCEEGILSFICVLIFMFSSCVMLPIELKNVQYMVLYIIPLFLLMEISYAMKNKAGSLIRWCIPVIVVAGVLIYLFKMKNAADISAQLDIIVGNYMMEWNSYYEGTEISVENNDINNVFKALLFMVIMSFTAAVWVARMVKKNIIVSIVPFTILILEHLVNVSPDNISIFLLFAGILLSNAACWKNPEFVPAKGTKKAGSYIWVFTCVLILAMCFVTKLIGTPSKDDIYLKAEKMKSIRNDVVKAVTGIDYEKAVFGEKVEPEKNELALGEAEAEKGASGSQGVDGRITNKKPEYKNRPIMKITLDVKPKNNLYLKTYHGSILKPDTFEFNDDTLSDIKSRLIAAGYDVERTYEDMIYYANDAFAENYGNEKVSKYIMPLMCDIDYIIPQKDVVPMPYFAIVLFGGVGYKSDILYSTKHFSGPVYSLDDISIWDVDPDYLKWVKHIKKDTVSDWETWYYSNVYSTSGYNMRYEPSEETVNLTTQLWNNIEKSKKFKKNQELLKNIDIRTDPAGQIYDTRRNRINNEKTLLIANEVKKWLAENMTYSLELDELAPGEDPVDYFMHTSKKGYCAHFASAAVTLLHDLHVRSRYATGYVATVDAFEEKNERVEATVLDSDAHAWVEIFLDGIGWVPFEVTNGYSVEERLEKKKNETATEAHATASPAPSPTVAPTDDKVKNNNGASFNHIVKNVVKVAVIIVIAVFFVSIIFVIINSGRKRKMLVNAINRRRTLYAVKSINRRLYKKLRTTGRLLKVNVGDDKYEEVLKKTYPEISESDWKRFMDIAKAAAFSCEIITEEEMDFCYEIYKKCC